MKKIIIALLTAILLFGTFSTFVGCGSEQEKGPDSEITTPDDKDPVPEPEVPEKESFFNYTPSDSLSFYGLFEEDKDLFNNTPKVQLAEDKYQSANDEGITAYYIDAMVNKDGEQLRTFAYVGIPKTASKDNKCPAIVLVHGGGGTAFIQWVREWMSRGFAAIAMDTYGLVPPAEGETGPSHRNDEKIGHANLGIGQNPDYEKPAHSGHFTDHEKPIREQFVYYCCSTVIASHSYLRSLDCIDTHKIGMMGISWGGFFTSVMTALDTRLAFTIPTYGCLSLTGTNGHFGRYFKNFTGARPWDDASNLANIETPILWLNDTKDPYFPPEATTRCATLSKNSFMSVIMDFGHGHCFDQPEPYIFAKSVVEDDMHMIHFTKQPSSDDFYSEVAVPQGVTAQSVRMYETNTDVLNDKTSWTKTELDQSIFEGQETFGFSPDLKADTVYFYFEITDNAGHVISSHFVKI